MVGFRGNRPLGSLIRLFNVMFINVLRYINKNWNLTNKILKFTREDENGAQQRKEKEKSIPNQEKSIKVVPKVHSRVQGIERADM